MSPVRACAAHGAPNCARCKAARKRQRAPRRAYSDTAAYRAMLALVLETFGPACHYAPDACVYFPADTTDDDRVLAHLIPHALGGEFVLENLRCAHRSCNARDNGARRG